MPRKVYDDNDISRGNNFAKACENLFPKQSRRRIGALLGGVPESTIRTWEDGKPIANRALADLDRRGISLTWLLRSEGEMMKNGERIAPED